MSNPSSAVSETTRTQQNFQRRFSASSATPTASISTATAPRLRKRCFSCTVPTKRSIDTIVPPIFCGAYSGVSAQNLRPVSGEYTCKAIMISPTRRVCSNAPQYPVLTTTSTSILRLAHAIASAANRGPAPFATSSVSRPASTPRRAKSIPLPAPLLFFR